MCVIAVWSDGWNVDHQYSLLRLIGQIVLTRPDRTAKQVKRPGFQYVEKPYNMLIQIAKHLRIRRRLAKRMGRDFDLCIQDWQKWWQLMTYRIGRSGAGSPRNMQSFIREICETSQSLLAAIPSLLVTYAIPSNTRQQYQAMRSCCKGMHAKDTLLKN